MLRSLQASFALRCSIGLLVPLVAVCVVEAHPNESSAYSMRSLVRMSENGLSAMVLLEVPLTTGLAIGGVVTLLAPVGAALGALAALLAKVKVGVVRTTGEDEE